MLTGSDRAATLYEMMKPNGSSRRRIGAHAFSAVVNDVALLDRFEPVVEAVGAGTGSYRRLDLYDISSSKLVAVAFLDGVVVARQDVIWWSTGDQETAAWHSLDLTTLSP